MTTDPADISDWLRYETYVVWTEHVRTPWQARQAVGMIMHIRGVPFREALLHAVEQGAVIPMSPHEAIADLARCADLLESLQRGPESPPSEPE